MPLLQTYASVYVIRAAGNIKLITSYAPVHLTWVRKNICGFFSFWISRPDSEMGASSEVLFGICAETACQFGSGLGQILFWTNSCTLLQVE